VAEIQHHSMGFGTLKTLGQIMIPGQQIFEHSIAAMTIEDREPDEAKHSVPEEFHTPGWQSRLMGCAGWVAIQPHPCQQRTDWATGSLFIRVSAHSTPVPDFAECTPSPAGDNATVPIGKATRSVSPSPHRVRERRKSLSNSFQEPAKPPKIC
jgi:hypothetical protein